MFPHRRPPLEPHSGVTEAAGVSTATASRARPFGHESLCADRLHDVDGETNIIGFRNFEDGEFVDPVPVRWDGERLVRK